MKNTFVQAVIEKMEGQTIHLRERARTAAYAGIRNPEKTAVATLKLREAEANVRAIDHVRALAEPMEGLDVRSLSVRLSNGLALLEAEARESAEQYALAAADPATLITVRDTDAEKALGAQLDEFALRGAIGYVSQVLEERFM